MCQSPSSRWALRNRRAFRHIHRSGSEGLAGNALRGDADYRPVRFENRKEIFEGVHRSFKFVVLTFEKGGTTKEFPAAFMRLDVRELERFPKEGAIQVSVDLARKLSPDALSLLEFKGPEDVRIAEKLLRFPVLGKRIEGTWNLILGNEFHMTNDSHLFKTRPGAGRLPLFEGKMIWQYDTCYSEPRVLDCS